MTDDRARGDEPPDEDRQPDHSEDARQKDTGDQMPEEAPSGQTEGGTPDDEDRRRASGAADAPRVDGGGSGGPPGAAGEGSQSTGNPLAAG